MTFYHAFQNWTLCACLAALGVIAVALFAVKIAAPVWTALRRFTSLPAIERCIVAVVVCGFVYYGATKQFWYVTYDGGITDGLFRNVVTNDTVHLYWTRDASGGVFVPESATVYIDYRPNTVTNAEWSTLAQTTVGAWEWSGTVENATNYNYNVWAYYIPPEPVHTNGVWTYKTHFDRNGEYALPLRARVEVNGVAIATPAEKRKDAEKRPYDAEVEYLESSGMQYINTGIRVDNTCGYNISFMGLDGNDRIVMGVKGAGDSRWCLSGSFSPNANLSWNTSSGYSGRGLRKIQEARMNYLNDRKRILNGVDVGDITSPLNASAKSYDVCMFAGYWGNATVSLYSVARIYSIQISRGQEIIFDGQPVRVGTTGAIYDKRGVGGMNPDGTARNDGLYFNRGTGNFGYGNDK